uniref:GDP-Man:Man(3)GlcNAc(2)-PP-Dol alpha-1,2-mannosyltransferase n=1 Tax=Ditylenchus dipsaci TaxID=166011 RepID=A0A915ENI6_9BILA
MMYAKNQDCCLFHPYCNAGGGGERVLWRAIYAMQKEFAGQKLHYVIYTGDYDVEESEILANVKSRFNINSGSQNLSFIFLKNRWLLEAKYYPRFTLILQMIGGYLLGLEALWKCSPEIFVDTTGIPLSLPLFRLLAGCKVVAYVHYPTITTEMIAMVSRRDSSYNNAGAIAKSSLLTLCKVLYYKDFSMLYRFCGMCTHLVMANGSWTASHLQDLWGGQPSVVYPACDVKELIDLPFLGERRLLENNDVKILSVGQIRPEKNHLLQLRIFAELKKQMELAGIDCKIKLIIAGGCRDGEDEKRVDFLKNYARENLKLDNDEDIEWCLNVPYTQLLKLFQTSLIGLHTMWNEHFGISVVEGLAAGNIMIAHNSAGPKMDIIGGYENDEKGNREILSGKMLRKVP